jgi:hypothetical protein
MGADHFRLHVSDRFGDLFPGKSPMCRDEHWVLRDSDDSGMVQSVHPSPKNRPFASKATASVLFGSIPESRSKGHLRKLDDQQETTRDVNMSYNPKKKYP